MEYLRILALLFLTSFYGLPSFVHAQGAGIKWNILSQEAIELYRAGKYDRAVVLAQQALQVAKQDVGPDHPDVATSLNNLAMLYATQGDYSRAEPLYKRSLAIWEKALGPNHPDVAQSLNNLAQLYLDQGDYARAEPLYKRSLAIWEKVFGPNHPSVATALENLAKLYQAQGNHAKAKPFFKRALAIREKKPGSNYTDVTNSLKNSEAPYIERGVQVESRNTKQDSRDDCTIMAAIAEEAMQKRQKGIPIKTMLDIVQKRWNKDAFMGMKAVITVSRAYEIPVGSTEEEKRKMVSDFTATVRKACTQSLH